MKTITYRDKEYKTRQISYMGENVTISTCDLFDLICEDGEGDEFSLEEKKIVSEIDKKIFFYVSEEEFLLSEEDLIEVLEYHLGFMELSKESFDSYYRNRIELR